MTAIINTQNKPVIPELVKPALKAAVHPSKDIKSKAITVRSLDPAETQKSEQKKTSEQALNNAVSQLNTYVQSVNRNLEFNIDSDSGKIVVKVVDSITDELIRQIPSEEALHIAKRLDKELETNSAPDIFLIKARA